MTITEFLAARLDEDELAARNAGAECWDFTGTSCEVRVRKPDGNLGRMIAYCRHGNPVADDLALAIHIGWNHPARVLREVEAKRALVKLHVRIQGDKCWQCIIDRDYYPCPTMRALAAIWSDHPDYDPNWRPE